MRPKLNLWMIAVMLLLALVACGGEAIGEGDSSGVARPAFLNEWESGGATIVSGSQTAATLFEGANGQTYLINDNELQVYEFDSPAAAASAAATISPDGGMINNAAVRWAGAPYFFLQDNYIILYVGSDFGMFEMLRGSFGTAFAGAPMPQ